MVKEDPGQANRDCVGDQGNSRVGGDVPDRIDVPEDRFTELVDGYDDSRISFGREASLPNLGSEVKDDPIVGPIE